jgi:CRISPR-associated protein Cmr4
MYQKAYGIIETLAPLHVGASSGEENGNLNLIFRDQFTQTGIIPGSSIRGRFRADMRSRAKGTENKWYGHEAVTEREDSGTTEAIVKFEYASILWLPVYCPNQPTVRISSPSLLKRYQKLTGKPLHQFEPYSYYGKISSEKKTLFFNLGFLTLGNRDETLREYMPTEVSDAKDYLLLVVDDADMATIHDMALYRQSRVALESEQKKALKGAFFNVEALPEGTIMFFPIALRKNSNEQSTRWKDFIDEVNLAEDTDFYFGGLESIGFGRTQVTLKSIGD